MKHYMKYLMCFGLDSVSLFTGRKATWCCAWNSCRSQFSVGTEKSVLVLHVERRSMWEYNTNKSDPLTLTFSSQVLLYYFMLEPSMCCHFILE